MNIILFFTICMCIFTGGARTAVVSVEVLTKLLLLTELLICSFVVSSKITKFCSYEEEKKRCQKEWGVTPSKYKATIEWGGRRISEASNIVFSNGGRDPWRSGGVLDSLSDSLVAVSIPEGAHHLDLMFSHEDDPESVNKAREIEEEHIVKWIGEVAQREEEERKKKRGGDGANKLVSSSLENRAVAVVVE